MNYKYGFFNAFVFHYLFFHIQTRYFFFDFLNYPLMKFEIG